MCSREKNRPSSAWEHLEVQRLGDCCAVCVGAAGAGGTGPLPAAIAADELHGVNFVPAGNALGVQINDNGIRSDTRRNAHEEVAWRLAASRPTLPQRNGVAIYQSGDIGDRARIETLTDTNLRQFHLALESQSEPFRSGIRFQ